MGRQKGDANRSKSRPSSSSAAASLLQSSKTSTAGFGGYVGSSRIDIADTQDKEVVVDLDGEAASHLRRLAKKDPITRVKALRALVTLFKECPITELCLLLPNWIFEYRRLVQDDNQQVRECTHIAMSALASSVGRDLAPHLRSLMGAWWVSQFDTTKEVSSAAQQSFQVAFQGAAKRLDALMFCASDILYYIDGLLKLSPQTISEKSTPIEEASKKYELVISSALLALSALLDVLLLERTEVASTGTSIETTAREEKNIEKRKEVQSLAVEICLNQKYFRDFVKANNSQIRCGSYQVLRAFAQNVPIVFVGEGFETISGIALGCFSEKDPSCHQAMWDMVLLVSQKFPEVWNTASLRKFVLPRLWAFLRHAAYGSAQISYPCLLPLICLLPSSAVKPATGFFNELFLSLWEGHVGCHTALEDELALLKAIRECLLWIIDNAERYSETNGLSQEQLQSFIVENILLNILWNGYVSADMQVPNDKSLSLYLGQQHALVKGRDTNLAHSNVDKKLTGAHSLRRGVFSEQFLENLSSCITDLLAVIGTKNYNLACKFWNLFDNVCLEVITNELRHGSEDSSPSSVGCVSRISTFISDLGKLPLSSQMRNTLIRVFRALVASLYPVVKATNYKDAIELIAKTVSVFGPTLFSALEVSQLAEGWPQETEHECFDDEERCLSFVFSFLKSDLIPWCLDGHEASSSAKMELLLSIFEDDRFVRQWDFVLAHATTLDDEPKGVDTLNAKKVAILASLIEKFRGKFILNQCNLESRWDLTRLDKAAVAVARSPSLALVSSQQLLRQVLGGYTKDFCPPILSKEAVREVITLLLHHMLHMLNKSENSWVHYAVFDVLNPDAILPCVSGDEDLSADLGCAAVQTLRDSIYLVHNIDDQSELVVNVIACFFCIKWDCSLLLCRGGYAVDVLEANETDSEVCGGRLSYQSENISDSDGSDSLSVEDTAFPVEGSRHISENAVKLVATISSLLDSGICKSFLSTTRRRVKQKLVQCIRHAVIEGSVVDASQFTTMWARWFLALGQQLCADDQEQQLLISLMLEPLDYWPLFSMLPAKLDEPFCIRDGWNQSTAQDSRHIWFTAFVAKFASFLGWHKVVATIPLDITADSQEKESTVTNLGRIWLLIELLCTWQWPGGNALNTVIPFLETFTALPGKEAFKSILDDVISTFLSAVLTRDYDMKFTNEFCMGLHEDMDVVEDPFLRALLALLRKILRLDSPERVTQYAERFFSTLVLDKKCLQDLGLHQRSNVLPFILSVLSPALRKQPVNPNGPSLGGFVSLDTVVCEWMNALLSLPPSTAGSPSDWQHLWWTIISCFPLHPAGGSVTIMAASSARISSREKDSLLALFRKETVDEATSGFVSHTAKQKSLRLENGVEGKDTQQIYQETLAKLVATSIAYCWRDFEVQDWARAIKHMRIWLEAALLEAENFTKVMAEYVHTAEVGKEKDLQEVIAEQARSWQVELSWTAVYIFSLVHAIEKFSADSSVSLESLLSNDWSRAKQRNLNYILRIFFSSGMAESLVVDSVAGKAAGMAIASFRVKNIHFWENVAEIVLSATDEEKIEAARYLNAWTVGKDSVRSLYALLFSPLPIGDLQMAAYCLLTSAPFKASAVTSEESSLQHDQHDDETLIMGAGEQVLSHLAKIRHELAAVLETPHLKILDSAPTSPLRVQYFLAWTLFLSHLRRRSVSSPVAERMVQYIQDMDISSRFLDALFQHLPIRMEGGSQPKKKLPLGQAEKIESSAKRAAVSESVFFAIEGLWPLTEETVSILATVLYGLALQVLPACVRVWFTGLRDRSMALSVETLTTNFYSPQLLADEFSQVHKASLADESLSIKENQSMGEVTVVYKKEEAGMDMVIRLPKCYPLRAVEVDCTRRLGISESRLRKWMLSMAAFLRNQNGAIAEAIQIWKRNVDREFEGVEECPICYSIIHIVNHCLPRLACKTCKHKFHSACLYKWFSTSHKSTCPLCQTPF